MKYWPQLLCSLPTGIAWMIIIYRVVAGNTVNWVWSPVLLLSFLSFPVCIAFSLVFKHSAAWRVAAMVNISWIVLLAIVAQGM